MNRRYAKRPLTRAAILLALCTASTVLIKWYGALPSLANRTVSNAAIGTETTRLGRLIGPLVSAHGSRSGVYGLLDARDAFAARVRLAEAAQRSLDIQYYIWHKDLSGTLLFD